MNNKKKVLIVLLVIFVLVSVVLFSIRKRPSVQTGPFPSVKPIFPSVQEVSVNKIVFDKNVVYPEIPNTLFVYEASMGKENLFTLAEELSRLFSLKKNDKIPNSWLSDDQSQILFFNEKFNFLSYLVDEFKNPNAYYGSKNPSRNNSLSEAKKFAESTKEWKELVPEESRIEFFKSTLGESIRVSESEANLIKIPLSFSVDGYPLRAADNTLSSLYVTFGQKNKIVRIDAYPESIQISSKQNDYPTISIEDAKKIIEEGKGILIDSSIERPKLEPVNNLSIVTILKVYLEYRVETTQKLAVPYLRFEGISSLSSGEIVNVVYILPAIDSKYINK